MNDLWVGLEIFSSRPVNPYTLNIRLYCAGVL